MPFDCLVYHWWFYTQFHTQLGIPTSTTSPLPATCVWRRGSESNKNSSFFQNSLLVNYRPTTRGVPPHNCRTPIESGIFECVSRTRHYRSNTNQLLTNYPFTTGSLALSLALFLPLFCSFRQGEGRFAACEYDFYNSLGYSAVKCPMEQSN
jgi:hypothetical protein